MQKSFFYKISYIIVVILIITILSPSLISCQKVELPTVNNNNNKYIPHDIASIYIREWENLNFNNMYKYLSKESKSKTKEKDFVDRYENIYSSIEIDHIEILSFDLEEEPDMWLLPIDISFYTDTLGEFSSSYKIPIIEEEEDWKIDWSPSLIFPGLEEDDKIRLVSLHAHRGDIEDRDRLPIVIEGEAYTVCGVPNKIPNKDSFAEELASLLEMNKDNILKELSRDWVKDDTLVPIRNLPFSIDEEFKNQILAVEGVMLVSNLVEDSRRYLDNNLYSHTIGYVQRVNAEDLKENEDYDEDDLIGRQGIEAIYEDYLRGYSGYSLYITDSDNNKKATIAEKPAKHGNNLTLTFDGRMQDICRRNMEDHVGTIVIMNGHTGELLSMVSTPDYNPNDFPNGIFSSTWEELNDNPDKPFINRASYSLYPPGSTIKPFTAAIALEEGVLNTNTTLEIAKNLSWTPDMPDWNAPPIVRTPHPEGDVNLDRAIIWSDNIYFAWASLQVGFDAFQAFYERCGIGEPMPFDLNVSTSSLKHKDSLITKRLLATSGIGQGEFLITPLQLTAMYSAFLNDGDIILPQMVRDIRDSNDNYIEAFERLIWKEEAISKGTIDILLPSLESVVTSPSGTGHRLFMPDIRMLAKTGTAEKDNEGENEIAWLVAMTPDTPEPLIITIALEVKSKEGHIKFDIIKDILEEYYRLDTSSMEHDLDFDDNGDYDWEDNGTDNDIENETNEEDSSIEENEEEISEGNQENNSEEENEG